ncbi:hypothetical protein HHX47_DHR1000080 [Lentinula edodes]|nr:hypothetical protein HHX47_DHR1000080 [Lentinula edodes]
MDGSCPYIVVKTLNTPAPISSFDFGHAGHLFAGSDDGTLRVYDLSSFKVLKAVRGLKNEVSSIACFKRSGSEFRDAWVACGNQVQVLQSYSTRARRLTLFLAQIFLFKMDMSSMIATAEDAILSLRLTEDDDVLNEVCACVKFVPDRPREIVSAGYDETFLHFEFREGAILSQQKISFSQNTEGVSLSPPFILSTAFSSTGILAAGTADGSLWIGLGGQKVHSKTKSKRYRKWNGLSDGEKQIFIKVVDGPIVAIPDILTTSTLLGSIAQWRINSETSDRDKNIKELWRKKGIALEKVNALVTNDTKIVIGGFSKDGKGIIEIWDRETPIETSI